MKKFVAIVLAAAFLLCICAPVWANNRPNISRAQHRRNLQNRNYFPPGWRYEAGFAVWRRHRNLPLTRQTYRLYRNDRVWHNRMRTQHRPQQFALDTIDWTIDELAFFLHQNRDLFRFHPAGYED